MRLCRVRTVKLLGGGTLKTEKFPVVKLLGGRGVVGMVSLEIIGGT